MKSLPVRKRPYLARRILDVGAGHNPFKGVTHVLDMDLTEGGHRCGNQLQILGSAVLIQGRATELPFRTASFDYIYASHVLEHVDRPQQACQEVMRVGAAGYIETPSPLLEQGLALKDVTSPELWFHKWFVFCVGDRLVFEPKTRQEVTRFCSCADGQFIREFYEQIDFRDAQHCLRPKAKTTIFFWKSSFEVEVRDKMVDCRQDNRRCRFMGMRAMLLASCNDLFRAPRVLRLKKTFPQCRQVFQRYGHRTLLIP